MSDKKNSAKPASNKEKFKPANAADEGEAKSRKEHEMKNVARGSEGDRRRSAQNRA